MPVRDDHDVYEKIYKFLNKQILLDCLQYNTVCYIKLVAVEMRAGARGCDDYKWYVLRLLTTVCEGWQHLRTFCCNLAGAAFVAHHPTPNESTEMAKFKLMLIFRINLRASWYIGILSYLWRKLRKWFQMSVLRVAL